MEPKDTPEHLFAQHLVTVAARWEEALAFAGFDSAIVTAGESRNYFLDDQAPPQKLNPHFLQWCPSETALGSALLVRPGRKTALFFYRPDDYWHQPPELPAWADAFEVRTFSDRDTLLAQIEQAGLVAGNHVALVGEAGADRLSGFPSQDVNPTLLLNHLHFGRAEKTDFELACMRLATRKGVLGHLAARRAFEEGGSEFQINHAYLAASEQNAADLPYASIVALNEHAGILHYQHYDRRQPAVRRSFLIDAGGSHHGYAADITRTYAAPSQTLFAELIGRLDDAQQQLIAGIDGAVDFLDLHIDMHRHIARILVETGLMKGSAEAAFEQGLTETFLPHGLGHLIGLQTHDVGGQQRSAEGGIVPPPDNYPSLRLTRRLGARMPVTIEPGIYFIPQLLEQLRQSEHGERFAWEQIEALAPCGGIRIEDNIVIHDDRTENLTRNAFAEAGAS